MTDPTITAAARQTETTRAGVCLNVRPAFPADETALADFFDRVSDEDRRFRFLSAHRHLTHEQLVPLVDADHESTESLIAFDADTHEIVASAMLACDKDMAGGEIAVSVRSDYRGKGVGWTMLDVLAGEAQRRGLKRVVAIEDRENHAAIELEREKGFVPHAMDDDPHLVLLEKTFG
ncbi:MAG: GNAT family N-acetyltransferase [Sphingomonadales bacterium]|nr:GNAT family N-acetyltransferase [Sphingomonadales bacterium]MDE2569366.1 GNAT family N-acetyltransferase [Sphingomonadales bacterium]